MDEVLKLVTAQGADPTRTETSDAVDVMKLPVRVMELPAEAPVTAVTAGVAAVLNVRSQLSLGRGAQVTATPKLVSETVWVPEQASVSKTTVERLELTMETAQDPKERARFLLLRAKPVRTTRVPPIKDPL